MYFIKIMQEIWIAKRTHSPKNLERYIIQNLS
jgi:hypothetical protein